MGPLMVPALALLILLGACQESASVADPAVEPPLEAAPACGPDSYLSTRLYGSIDREIRWSEDDMYCESMLRPDGKGVRLRFTGEAAGNQLAIILALPELKPGTVGVESPTVVTLTVEGSGRFFSTASAKSCWSDINAQDPVAGNGDLYTINGTLFCVASLGEINGDAAISIPEMAFRGFVDWGAK